MTEGASSYAAVPVLTALISRLAHLWSAYKDEPTTANCVHHTWINAMCSRRDAPRCGCEETGYQHVTTVRTTVIIIITNAYTFLFSRKAVTSEAVSMTQQGWMAYKRPNSITLSRSQTWSQTWFPTSRRQVRARTWSQTGSGQIPLRYPAIIAS